MSYQSRMRAARRVVSRLPERVASTASEIAAGKVIARATGTRFVPAHSCSRREGGGLIWDYTTATQSLPEPVGTADARVPLQVSRNPVSGLFDIVPG